MFGLVDPYVPRMTPPYKAEVPTLPANAGRVELTGHRRIHGPLLMVVRTKVLLNPIEMPVLAIPFLATPVLTNVLELGRPTDMSNTNVL